MPEWRRASERNQGPKMTERGVHFSIYAPRAGRVNIVGDFNNWSMTADPLYDRDGIGLWTILMPITPGRYEYKYILNGEKWIPDPGNSHEVDDGFGGLNSVLVVE
ncbi:MAG: isoamylase early set domain-containing protein [Candidatus Krumholzibacteria bacterium]|nr:isoamylase early set domain-containing protein [Candidatus Krumholzibacteria bacterium]